VAGIPEGPDTFFCLSPVERAEALCFSILRGEVQGRLDVNYWRLTPLVNQRLGNARFPVEPLGGLLQLVQYGCSELAKDEPPGIAIIRMNNLQSKGWDLSELKYIELSERELNSYKLVPGDILFNRTNSKELVGKCEVFEESGEWVFASYLIRVRTEKNRLLPQFASDFLGAAVGRLQIDRLSRQIIGMTNINAEEIREIRIPLPSISEQEKLVAAMDTARKQRHAKQAQADAVLAGLDSFLLEALGLTPPPVEFRTVYAARRGMVGGARMDAFFFQPRLVKADALAGAFCAGVWPLSSLLAIEPVNGIDAREYMDSGQRYLRVQNVKPYQIEAEQAVRVAPPSRKKLSLYADDVLLTRKGTFGVSAKVEAEQTDCLISSEVILLRLSRTSSCTPDFLVAWLNSSVVQAYLTRWKAGAIMGHITQDVVSRIPIPRASTEVQQLIATKVRMERDKAHRLRAEAEAGWLAAKGRLEEQLLGGATR
jgi:restriction endonuclease S subunit